MSASNLKGGNYELTHTQRLSTESKNNKKVVIVKQERGICGVLST